MANAIQLKIRTGGAAGAPGALLSGELAINDAAQGGTSPAGKVYIGDAGGVTE